MLLLGFKNIRKSLIKEFILGKDVTVTNVLSCYGHVYEKENHLSLNKHLVPLLKLLMSTENKLKRKLGYSQKVKKLVACVKSAKENG